MVDIATKSNDEMAAIAAGKVVLGMAISKAHVQEAVSSQQGFTIVIENATLQALQHKSEPVAIIEQKPIEVEYVERSENN